MNQLISVVVPVYNVLNYLEKCVQTLIKQTYTNLEIILVDDGSTDGSSKLCDEIAKNDNRIKVIHKENGGLSSARNAGLDIALGEYISFIDSDDSIHLQFYKILMNTLKETGADIVQCEILSVSEQNVSEKEVLTKFDVVEFTGEEALKAFYKSKITVFKSSCNKLFKRELFQALRYPGGKIFEDRWIAARLYTACKKVVYLNLPLYYYTENPNSIMHARITEKHYDTCMLYIEHYDYFREGGNIELSEMALRQFFISLLNLRYNFKRYSNIYQSNRDILNRLFSMYRNQLMKCNTVMGYEKVAIVTAWYFQFLYNGLRDLLDFFISHRRG